ncbi:MAG: shikimate dehydrogenase [Lachnospiraceae bacterium]|nr:shikimate dehydrogenase [Lachnospiraceae bacterium]
MNTEIKNDNLISIGGKTRITGLLGYPVEHTKSPLIHNTLAAFFGDDLAYIPFPVSPDDLEAAVKGAHALGILGLNVTVPHKSNVIPFLSEIDPLAGQVGAVNTLVRTVSGFKGYNTDLPGLSIAMRRAGFEIQGKNVLILGAGGAARAAAFMCAGEKPAKLLIANRSVDKAERIVEDIRNSGIMATENKDRDRDQDQETVISAVSLSDLYSVMSDDRFLAVQCTSVGLAPHDKDCVIDPGSDEGKAIFDSFDGGVDLIYKPAETVFLSEISKRGGKTMNGLAMLLYQGVIAYELFTGRWNGEISADEEVLNRIFSKL